MARSFSWVDGISGAVYPLTTTTSEVEYPVKGHLGVAWNFIEQAYAAGDGAALSAVKAPVRDWLMMFSLFGSDEDALDDLLDLWTGILTPSVYPGAIRSTRNDGTQRDFVCNYKSGFDQAEESPASGRFGNAQFRTPLTFRGGPYWLDTVPQSRDYTPPTTTALWFPFGFPYSFADSTVFARDTVPNDGHAQAWPVWTIFGPGDGITITNETTGLSLSIDYRLDVWEPVTIDTREPGNRTIISGWAGNLMQGATGTMFPLERGPNTITVRLGAATEKSGVHLDFQRRWNGP